jgi:hypothetical protein
MKKQIFITEFSFNSKKDLEEYTRKLINKLECPSSIKPNHPYFSFLIEIIKRHPDAEDKIGVGIDYLELRCHPIHNNPALYIHRVDDSEIDISWVKCCRARTDTARSLLSEAMRQAVAPFVISYKKSCSPLSCQMCQANNLDYKDYHVDHKSPKFQEIRDEFSQKINLLIPTTFSDDERTHQRIFKKEDSKFQDEWVSYHNQHATYQILCRLCNCSVKR